MPGAAAAPPGSDEYEPVDRSGDAARPRSYALVMFGASGDLARRKLLPALYRLHRRGLLDATPGMWTDRLATEASHRLEAPDPGGVLWWFDDAAADALAVLGDEAALALDDTPLGLGDHVGYRHASGLAARMVHE